MFNTDYFINQQSDNYNSIHSKKSSLLSNTASGLVAFEFSPPIRCLTLRAIDLTKIHEINKEWLEFDRPRKYHVANNSKTLINGYAAPQLFAKHKVIVEQSPFSALKSLKAQESTTTKSNIEVISSLRNHPYNNSKNRPATSIEAHIIPDLQQKSLIQTDQPVSSEKNVELSQNGMNVGMEPVVAKLTGTNKTDTQRTNNKSGGVKRNSSSNAILAHLRSISPNFKSIFVRPRNLKPIDSSAILNKAKLHYKNITPTSQHENSILPLLYSSSAYPSRETPTPASLAAMMVSIEPREIHINSSVDDLLRKFASENGALSKTLKNFSTCSSNNSPQSSPTTKLNSLERAESTTSSLRAPLLQTVLNLPQAGLNLDLQIDIISPNEVKWTCMVCLSKHPSKQDICQICGSEKPASKLSQQLSSSLLSTTLLDRSKSKLQYSPPTKLPSNELFSSYLINELGLKHKLCDYPDSRKSSSTLSSSLSPKVNPYLRKWTCVQCNFSNDSLKIVCLNCRWIKTSSKNSKSEEVDLSNTAKEPKRTKADEMLLVDLTPSTGEPVCASCKSPIVAESTQETPVKTDSKRLDFSTATTHTPEKSTTIPTSTPSFPSTSIFAKPATPKWTCDTCLVSNPETTDKCACCSSPKPSPKVLPTSTPKSVPTQAFPPAAASVAGPEATSLFKKLASTAQKWTCDTCLVSNAELNEKCACCMTPRPGVKKTNEAPSIATTSALSKSDIFQAPVSSTIKFGASTTGPISFGSSFGSTTTGSAPVHFGGSSVFKVAEESKKSDGETINKNTPFSFSPFSSTPITEISKQATKTSEIPFMFGKKTEETESFNGKSSSLFLKSPLASSIKTSTVVELNSFASTSTPPKFQNSDVSKEISPPFSLGSQKTGTISTFSFGTTSTTTANTTSQPTFSLFGATQPAKPAETITTSANTTSQPKFSLFGATQPAKPAETITTSANTTSQPTFSLFGATQPAKPAETITTSANTTSQPTFSLFGATQPAKPVDNTTTPLSFSTSGFGAFSKESASTNTTSSFFQLPSTTALVDKPANQSIFGSNESSKFSFGNLSTSTASTSSIFGDSSNTTSLPSFTGTNLPIFETPTTVQKSPSTNPTFNFFNNPSATATTPNTSLFSTQTLTPSSINSNNNNSSFQFTPLSFNTNTTTPVSEPNKPFQPTAFSLNVPPVINFTSSAFPGTGFVFSGSSDQQPGQVDSQQRRKIAKGVRRR